MSPIQSAKDNKIHYVANRNGHVYTMNFDDLDKQNVTYFSTIEKDSWYRGSGACKYGNDK